MCVCTDKFKAFSLIAIDVKTVPAGYAVGYNGTFKTKRETKIAIVPIGHYVLSILGLTIRGERSALAISPHFISVPVISTAV